MYDPTKPHTDQVLDIIRSTWKTEYVNIHDEHIIEKIGNSPTCDFDHTDGIGTKGWFLWRARDFTCAAHDAFAMNINDLVMARAIPYKIQNHLTIPVEDSLAITMTMEHLATLCKNRSIAITGGETSVQNNVDGMELSITMTGMVGSITTAGEWKFPPKNQCKVDDYLIGLRSNGIHSNGWTLVRDVFGEHLPNFSIRPTRLYSDVIYPLFRDRIKINGLSHITGGAFTKLRKVLHPDCDIQINEPLLPHEIFKKLHERGICDEQMYKTFNCGIGFVLSVPEESLHAVGRIPEAAIIGRVVKGTGLVHIKSAFTNSDIAL